MEKIFKYTLNAEEIQSIRMPVNARILTAQSQVDDICIWALVTTGETMMEDRTIEVIRTGEPIVAVGYVDESSSTWTRYNRKYISTVQFPEDGLVFHVFELTK